MLRLVLCLLVVPGAGVPAFSREEASVSALIDKAVARSKSTDEQIWNHSGSLRFTFVQITENLDDEGRVKDREERHLRIYPIHGVPYARLVEIDGRPLTAEEQEKEQRKEDEFRRNAEKNGKRKPETNDEDRLVFEEVVKKYRFRLEDPDSLDGRSTHVLSFEPRSRDLPRKHDLDPFLNRTRGKLWIDEGTDEVRKIEFETVETIKLLWGLAGNISTVEGTLERRPIAGLDLWAPSRFAVYLKGRTGFGSLHRNLVFEWRDYETMEGEAAGPAP